MQIRIWTVGLIVALVDCSGSALAQAAAEAALTHGLSAGASSSAGSAFGKLGNQLAGRLGQQVSTAAPRQVITTLRPGVQKQARASRPATQTTSAPLTNGGSLIASIQGAEPQASTCAPVAAADTKTASTPAQKPSNCSAAAAPDAILYKSEITLPASK
jgi:hypothetical protein